MRFRSLTLFALSAGLVALSAADATAGPLLRLLRERRAAHACPCQPQQFAPQPAPAASQSCPGGVCPLPVVKGAAAEPVVVGGVFDRLSDGPIRTRWLLRAARDGAVDRLVQEKRITPAAARELVNRVDDETITTHVAQKYGAAAGGGKLEQFFTWLWEHREELIKFILSIVALFG